MRKRPVMFWLHGGGYAVGSGGEKAYEGHNLCRKGDVVVVTINHRLAAPGYLYLGGFSSDFADSGSCGQLDQILALRWVRDNISQFGGDPNNVMIFGESGGGAKVSTLLAMPAALGLFHKAVIQSGAALRATERQDAEELAAKTLDKLRISRADVHKLQSMPLDQILKAATASEVGFMGGTTLSPVVDDRSLRRHPFDPDAPPPSRDVPLMVGTTKDEAALLALADPGLFTMTGEQIRQKFQAMIGPKGEEAFEIYSKLRPNGPPSYWFSAMITGRGAWTSAITLAERKFAQGGAPVYMYRLDWETPVFGGILRTPHGLDSPLVFDNSDKTPLIMGPGPNPAIVGAAMSDAWINFARLGDPSLKSVKWPPYEPQDRATMIFDVNSRVVHDPDKPAREFGGTGRIF